MNLSLYEYIDVRVYALINLGLYEYIFLNICISP